MNFQIADKQGGTVIYLDNAATSHPKPPEVALAVASAINSFGNASRGAHGLSLAAARCVEKARGLAAELFGCPDPARVVFTKNVTEALNIAIAAVPGHLVTTEAEHNSVLRPALARKACSVAEVDALGRYTAADIEKHIRPDTSAVVVAQASNLSGNPAPLEDIGRLCRERGLVFIVDAAQTAGLFDIRINELGIDALCFTGHKSLYGPQGTGGMCLGERFDPPPLMRGGSGSRSFETTQPDDYPDRLEAGTINAHGLAGLAAGLEYVIKNGPARLLAGADQLARYFYQEASQIPGLVFYGDYQAEKRAPIVTLNINGCPAEEAAAALADDFDIAVRAGAHCAPLLHRRFGTERLGALRFSFSHFNRPQDAAAAVSALRYLAEGKK